MYYNIIYKNRINTKLANEGHHVSLSSPFNYKLLGSIAGIAIGSGQFAVGLGHLEPL